MVFLFLLRSQKQTVSDSRTVTKSLHKSIIKCVVDYYLQPSKLGDPGHNLVVWVNNLGPDPGKTCM